MAVIIYCLCGAKPLSAEWFWLGAFFLTVGILLDAADGFWARHISAGGPTREGQYLDQFVDKWGFVYPLLFFLCYDRFATLPIIWHVLVAILLGLDTVSCRKHYRDYRTSVILNIFNPSNGAVGFGKWKFVAQNVAICLLVASLHEPLTLTVSELPWIFGPLFVFLFANPSSVLAVAVVLAVLSLFKRSKRAPVSLPAALASYTS
jgi:phosphatidylglycerophosphate synthase